MMKRRLSWLVIPLLFMAWSPVLGDRSPLGEGEQASLRREPPFPILTRLNFPREYGFFVGDEIPLTLIIEAVEGVRIDLVNLPRKGSMVGVFEVREARIKAPHHHHGKRVYQIDYVLQYFGPAPLTLSFPPLEILYAEERERDGVSGEYHYHRLFSQPASIHIARIGPLTPANARTLTEPIATQRPFLTWNLLGLGGLSLAAGLWVLGRHGYERITTSRRTALIASNPANQALQQLKDIENLLLEDRQHEIPCLVSEVVRRFLASMYACSPFTKPTTELLHDLPDSVYRQDIALLLLDCDVMKFGGRPNSRKASQELLQRAMALIQRSAPADASGGGNGIR